MAKLDQTYAPVVVRDRDDIGSNRSSNQPLLALHKGRMSRRTAMKGFVTTAAIGAIGGSMTSRIAMATGGADPSSLDFQSIPQVITEDHQVAPGYTAKVLIRWGDKVVADAPAWDAQNQSAAAQAKQFGYNNDFVAFLPLPKGSESSEHGLLHVNHEYTSSPLMFPNYSAESHAPELSQIEMAAHGASVIEVRKQNGQWTVVPDSAYARRITVETEMAIGGPVAGHQRLRTSYDPTGTRVRGTLNNCAGGKTPWGTVLMAEENFHGYFGGELPRAVRDHTAEVHMEQANYDRYGLSFGGGHRWGKSADRFDLGKEPNEPNRFGWMVEYDPYDPNSTPVKRTALGRLKHEGATCWVNKDGRLVVYCGDDERFEYLYRYVSDGSFDARAGGERSRLLDEGTLYVASFDEDKLTWLPLLHGAGRLTREHGFSSQADVLIETRRAADLLGATPMDRPEDVQPNPVNGRVYVMLSNNSTRKPEQVDAVNPRPENAHGQIVELIPPGREGMNADHTADQYDWEFLLLAGDPKQEGSGAEYHPDTPAWLSSPDNCAFDAKGRIWISTDQGGAQRNNNIPDGMYACDLSGEGRAYVKFFYGVPVGAEMCGPEFTPDGRTLFVAVQHPAESAGSTFETPATRWPDFADGVPPRPSIVAITKDDGGLIGG